jgi:hypothetical protein
MAVPAQTAPYPPITIPLKIDQVPGNQIYSAPATPAGFIWNWSNRSSKVISSDSSFRGAT